VVFLFLIGFSLLLPARIVINLPTLTYTTAAYAISDASANPSSLTIEFNLLWIHLGIMIFSNNKICSL